MPPQDREMLEKINRIAMRSEGRDLIKTIDISIDQRATLQRIVDDSRLPDLAREFARKMLEDPRSYRTMEQVDMEKAKRVEDSVERDIKRAIHQGRLSDPSKSVDDFMKKFQQ